MQTGTRRVRRSGTPSRCLRPWWCYRDLKGVNHPDERGLSVRIPHVCDRVGRYCGKICPKRNWELSRENMHLACRNEYNKRVYEGRCVVCNGKDICGDSRRGDNSLPASVILEETETDLKTLYELFLMIINL